MFIPNIVLIDLLQKSTKGIWKVVSDENSDKFSIEVSGSEPPKAVLSGVQDVNHYDLRLLALARELALEVLEARQKELDIKQRKSQTGGQ